LRIIFFFGNPCFFKIHFKDGKILPLQFFLFVCILFIMEIFQAHIYAAFEISLASRNKNGNEKKKSNE